MSIRNAPAPWSKIRLEGNKGWRLGRIRAQRNMVLLLAALPFIAGCVTISSGPDRIFDADAEIPALRACAAYVPAQNDVTSRNTFIAARMYAIDIEYSVYFEQLLKERQLGTSVLDATLLGLTAATTIVHGEAAKTAIGAISTGFAGAKSDIDQDIYMAQTLQILMNAMEAQRLQVRNRIDGNMKLAVADYSAWRSLTDLDDYYKAGTLAGALQYLASSTGANAQNQKDLQNGTTPNGQAATKSTLHGANQPATSPTSLKGPAAVLPSAQ
jgi:hypothetical protein